MSDHLQRSRKQEKRGAKIYGGTQNAGSGNGSRKNDVRTADLSIEFKTTTQKGYRLTLAELLLCSRQALIEGRDALFGIDFEVGKLTHRFVVQTEHQYLAMADEIRGLREEIAEYQKFGLSLDSGF